MYAFGFHESTIFSLEYIKVCLHHDLATHVESDVSATRNMKSRLEFKFPTPMSGDQIPSLPGRKKRQMRGVCLGRGGGGGGC